MQVWVWPAGGPQGWCYTWWHLYVIIVVPGHRKVPGPEPGTCNNATDTNWTPTVFWYSRGWWFRGFLSHSSTWGRFEVTRLVKSKFLWCMMTISKSCFLGGWKCRTTANFRGLNISYVSLILYSGCLLTCGLLTGGKVFFEGVLTSISSTLITSIPERFARLTSSTLGFSIKTMVFTECFLSSRQLSIKSTLLLKSHMMVEMEAAETCTQVSLRAHAQTERWCAPGSHLYLSRWCRWSLQFPECRTKEPRPESMCNMQARWWSTTHTQTQTLKLSICRCRRQFLLSFHYLS